jgi:hypothetical protein
MPSSPFRITLACAAIALCGCLIKDKSDKPLASGGLVPPWDPAKFTPKHLEGAAPPDTAGTFAVFTVIARIDSLSGDPKGWKADPEAADTLRIAQMLDTGFVFPQNPEAVMPYGYDDSFRDDTLFRSAYGNGLFTQDHPCAANFVLTGQFLHPARWLKRGLSPKDIETALGKPMYNQAGVMRYLSRHAGARPSATVDDTTSTANDYSVYDIYEGVNLYFQADSLFAAVLQKSQPCH